MKNNVNEISKLIDLACFLIIMVGVCGFGWFLLIDDSLLALAFFFVLAFGAKSFIANHCA